LNDSDFAAGHGNKQSYLLGAAHDFVELVGACVGLTLQLFEAHPPN
jgi:hypothetical protein